MDELVEQFVVEVQEIVDQATDDLLALEGDRGSADRLDSVFRAFHTLKGSAGIVDFQAMTETMHALEDLLIAAREQKSALAPNLIEDCLGGLDLVRRWLERMRDNGEVPAGADQEAADLIARLSRQAVGDDDRWLSALLERFPARARHARSAVRYAPRPDSFFRGEDPLAVIGALPGLLDLEVRLAGPPPQLERFDTFRCVLVFAALSAESAEIVAGALQPVIVDCSVQALEAPPPEPQLTLVDRLIGEQIAMLEAGGKEAAAGRLASAVRVAINTLDVAARVSESRSLAEIGQKSLASGDPRAFVEGLRAVLAGAVVPAPAPARAGPAAEPAQTLRVDVEKIDRLVRLTGELLSVKHGLAFAVQQAESEGDRAAFANRLKEQETRFSRVLDEIQHAVLQVRVLPLRHAFQRLPRLVREVAVTTHKQVRLTTEGEDVEADKTVVETLFEPLLHILRNAVDHGIETPAARTAAGKPPTGEIRLKARRSGEHVEIEVSDDGVGIDVARIREVAIARGVISAEAAKLLAERELVDLIFAPGFTTSERVTSLSGRGVGMDAVRTAINRMGGAVAIDSVTGHGTSVRVTLPFSVAITRVLRVEIAGQAFGIPLDAVVETRKARRAEVTPVGATNVFVFRGQAIAALDLAALLGYPADDRTRLQAALVIVTVGGQTCALEVDRFADTLDVVLTPRSGLLLDVPGVAGTAILGDGRVLIVLELDELVS